MIHFNNPTRASLHSPMTLNIKIIIRESLPLNLNIKKIDLKSIQMNF